jgi:hypothetical protein
MTILKILWPVFAYVALLLSVWTHGYTSGLSKRPMIIPVDNGAGCDCGEDDDRKDGLECDDDIMVAQEQRSER